MAGRITKSEQQLKPDPRYGDKVLSKFINCVMLDGKKSTAQRAVYDALDQIQARIDKDKRDGMPEKATELEEGLRAAGFSTFYDEKGAVGRRYRRQDEAGTPFCVTVDGQTLEDQTVTIRDRDSLAQERIASAKGLEYVRERV